MFRPKPVIPRPVQFLHQALANLLHHLLCVTGAVGAIVLQLVVVVPAAVLTTVATLKPKAVILKSVLVASVHGAPVPPHVELVPEVVPIVVYLAE